MAQFSRVPIGEAKQTVLPPRRATQEQYREYIRQLNGEAGRLELTAEDKPITERARLKAAAQAEGVNLQIQRRGQTIVFWKTEEPPKPRGSGRRAKQIG